jgi:hypothetical protein
MAQLTKLKQFAEKRLKEDSTLRSLILSEPDELPDNQAIERAKIFLKLADKELSLN